MKVTRIKCKGVCKQEVLIIAPRLDMDGFDGVYLCPCCKSKDVTTLIKPLEIKSIDFRGLTPIIFGKEGKIKEVAPSEVANVDASPVAEQPERGEGLSIRQFYSGGRGDDQSRERSPTESQEPASNGKLDSGARSPYEEECSKYLGVAPDISRGAV